MAEIPHGVSFEERQKDLIQKKKRPSRLSRFLSSATKGRYSDPKPLIMTATLIILLVALLYFINLYQEKTALPTLTAPEGFKIIHPKDAPPRLEAIK